MKIIFWNINRKDLTEELKQLVLVEEPDVLVLAEAKEMSNVLLLEALNDKNETYFHNEDFVCEKIKLFSKFENKNKQLKFIVSGHRFMIRAIDVPNYPVFNLMCLHYPSKVNWSEDNQAAEAMHYKKAIEEAERKNGFNTIVLGDFNMNPFERGMVQTTGFHSTMSKQVANRKSRKVSKREYRFFYNPMWSFYGEHGKGNIDGTIYYNATKPINYFWNIFDQVILRPELIPYFDEEKLAILTNLGKDFPLLKRSGLINKKISDHLPISFTIKKEANV